MARRKTKRKFSVQANMKVFELSKAGTSLEFDVFAEGEKFGRLVVGRGSVAWYGRDWKLPKRLSWERFDRLMQDVSDGRRSARPTILFLLVILLLIQAP